MACVIIWQLPGRANFDCLAILKEACREAEHSEETAVGAIAPVARDVSAYKLRSCQFNCPLQ